MEEFGRSSAMSVILNAFPLPRAINRFIAAVIKLIWRGAATRRASQTSVGIKFTSLCPSSQFAFLLLFSNPLEVLPQSAPGTKWKVLRQNPMSFNQTIEEDMQFARLTNWWLDHLFPYFIRIHHAADKDFCCCCCCLTHILGVPFRQATACFMVNMVG